MTVYPLPEIQPPATLNAAGQCCGVKPLPYKRPPQLFCRRCDRSYDPVTLRQQPNFAWKPFTGLYDSGFVATETHAAANVSKKTWDHFRESGLSRKDFEQVVREEIANFVVRYREAYA